MREGDAMTSIRNAALWIAAAIILGAAFYATLSIGKSFHAAEACVEDEAWIAVDYQTPGAFVDSHGVTRACVNVEEIK